MVFYNCQILSYLPIEDSLKTSVLATSWKNHWLHVPVLELNYDEFSPQDRGMFMTLINRFLTESSLLQKFKLKSSSVEIEGFTNLIGRVIKRGIQHLDLDFKGCRFNLDLDFEEEEGLYCFNEFMPPNLYTSKTLVSLKLTHLALVDDARFVVCIPCLKFMYLSKIRFVAPMTLEKLLSGCPALEELTFRRYLHPDIREPEVMRVRSRSLKRFFVPFKKKPRYGIGYRRDYVLEIDAPGLEYMSLNADNFHTVVVKNLTSLFTIDLDLKFTGECFMDPEDLAKRNEIRDFLTGITSVRHMIISEYAMETLERYSKVGPIPIFNNLSSLEAEFPSFSLQFVHALLESYPNLKHLIWIVRSNQTEAFEIINVPRGFVSTLECVEIECFNNQGEVLKIASYFLENSTVLKKLILRFIISLRCPQQLVEDLNKLTKRCGGCRILIEYEAYENCISIDLCSSS